MAVDFNNRGVLSDQNTPAPSAIQPRPRPRGVVGNVWEGFQDVSEFLMGTVGVGPQGAPMRNLFGELGRQLSPSSNPETPTNQENAAMRQGIRDAGRDVLFGGEPKEKPEKAEPSQSEIAPDFALQEARNSLNTVGSALKNTDDLLLSGTLTPQAEQQLLDLREDLALQLEQTEVSLKQAQAQMQVQDRIFEFDMNVLGLDLDVASLEKALQTEGGLGAQTMEAIQAITGNSDLTTEEQAAAMDAVVNRAQFSNDLVLTVNDLIKNQQDLERLEALPDVELLNEAGLQVEFFEPLFPNLIVEDPLERYDMTFTDELNKTFEGQLDALTDDQWSLFDNTTAMMKGLGVDHVNTQASIKALADSLGVDYTVLHDALVNAGTRADASEQAIAEALDAKKLVPGSEAMTYAVMEAGRTMALPVPDEFLMLLANSRAFHTLVDVKSKGVSGQQGDGTIAGVGGLTEAMYETIMGEPWSPDKGMQWELQALLGYIYLGFQGDPIAALNYYRTTGEWGGSAALEVGEDSG